MRELMEEYAGMVFVMLLGFGFVEGLAVVMRVILTGWSV